MASTDEVFSLLNAVNEVTLKRMENKEDHVTEILLVLAERLGKIEQKLGLPQG
jgi:hypothetical protein